jgi:hypothetical protein
MGRNSDVFSTNTKKATPEYAPGKVLSGTRTVPKYINKHFTKIKHSNNNNTMRYAEI